MVEKCHGNISISDMVIYSGKIWYICALTTLKIVNYLDIQTHDERKRAFDKKWI